MGVDVFFAELIVLRVSDPEVSARLATTAESNAASLRAAVALLKVDDAGGNKDEVEVLAALDLVVDDEPRTATVLRRAPILTGSWKNEAGQPVTQFTRVNVFNAAFIATPPEWTEAPSGSGRVPELELQFTLDETDVNDPTGLPSLGVKHHVGWAGTIPAGAGMAVAQPADDLLLLVVVKETPDVEGVMAIQRMRNAEREEVLRLFRADGRRERDRAVESLIGANVV